MIHIERKDYMNTLIRLRDKNLIKVLTGVRRCGKSTVMQMFREYLIADEVQQIKEFERLVDGLYVKSNIDVYVTGSNAYLLSSELGTLLTGRYIAIHILPFSFKEFLLTQTDISRTDLLFAKYLDTGGMPGIFDLPEKSILI